MEIETVGKAVILTYQCDVCKIGMLSFNGVVTENNKFENVCNNCNAMEVLDIDYPTTRIRPA